MDTRPAIACTLDATAMASRERDFADLAGRALVGRERAPGRVRLCFRLDGGVEEEVRALARREKECCAFFEFSIAREGEQISLVVSAPIEAEAFLDAIYEAATGKP